VFLVIVSGVFPMGDSAGTARAQSLIQSLGLSETAYDIEFDGLNGGQGTDKKNVNRGDLIEDALRASSLSVQLQGDLPRGIAGLRRRAERDVTTFGQVLRSQGYYDGTARYEIEMPEDVEAKPRITFLIDSGPAYVLESVTIQIGADLETASDDVMSDLRLDLGQIATAAAVIEAETRLARRYRGIGFPNAAVTSRRTVINREHFTMSVSYTVAPGPKAIFGETRVQGAGDVSTDFVRRNVTWIPGNLYDIRQVEETQRKLSRTGLFDTITITPEVPVDALQDGDPVPADITITVTERAHRSLGVGGSYSTSTGPGVNAFWEHRNLLSEGERFRTTLSLSEIERGFDSTFRKPLFLRDDQALVAEGELKDITSDAFDERRATAFIGLERSLSPVWTATVGTTLDLIQQDDNSDLMDEIDRVTLIGMRLNLRRDDTDDPLDPSRGNRFDLGLAPYHDITNDSSFLSSAATVSQYLRIDESGDFVLAGRAKIGSIVGADRRLIPAGKRFYAGGGGSVRGFGFQKLGPLDSKLDPLGGRSVVELGLELRTRLTETIGIVPFIEAGNVYQATMPSFDDLDLRWSGGLGFRYFTEIGPVRLDIATPFRKRANVDDSYQFYVSLGQAF